VVCALADTATNDNRTATASNARFIYSPLIRLFPLLSFEPVLADALPIARMSEFVFKLRKESRQLPLTRNKIS
jgi:hypothetical protein